MIDPAGITYYSSFELADLLYTNPNIDLGRFIVTDPEQYNSSVNETYANFPKLQLYTFGGLDVEKFDQALQTHYFMPESYANLDIAKWVLDQCKTQEELQRVGEELLLFQERELFNLLRWLKYFVDTVRENSVVLGVGRGSSVASYVLYLIGVHRINSMYYDLDIREFLK